MTERKPAGMNFTSWIDQQISDAAERGAFDDLPGAGKPLSKQDQFDGQAWVREYVRREGGSIDDCLPTPLKLRKEIEKLAQTIQDLRSEERVREVVGELNDQIMRWRRLPVGPPIFVPLVDADEVVAAWQRARASVQRPPESSDVAARPSSAASGKRASATGGKRVWRRNRLR